MMPIHTPQAPFGREDLVVLRPGSVNEALLAPLTPSERQVVLLAIFGASNADVAERRGTSIRTVANQLGSAYRKLGVNSRGELVARLAEREPRALEVWRVILEGRWALVNTYERDGKPCVVLRRNDRIDASASTLSPREQQVARMAALGHAGKYIAYELGIAESTVSAHLAAMKRKLGIRSRAELAVLLATLALGAADRGQDAGRYVP